MFSAQSLPHKTSRWLVRHHWLVLGFIALVAVILVIWLWLRPAKREAFELRMNVPAVGAGFELALYQSLGVRMEPGHTVQVLENGLVFDGLERDLRAATSSVHVLFYIWEKGRASDRISAALQDRARAGLQCRILVDDLGSPDFARDVQPALSRAGCRVRVFRPQTLGNTLARDHRKLAIVDGVIGYTGGLGVRDNWLGDGVHEGGWRDTSVRFSGPSVAAAQQAFAENWQEAGGELLPASVFPTFGAQRAALNDATISAAFVASTGSSELTRAERLTQVMLAAARRRIWIENAYFVPTQGVSELLRRKAREGVDVRLMMPGKQSDSKTSFGAQHAEFGSLIKEGVRVFEYQPTMLHAKTMLVDDELALVGSINLDPLSLSKLEEDALVVASRSVVDTLARSFIVDSTHAEEKH